VKYQLKFRTKMVGMAALAALVLAGCGSGGIEETKSSSDKECGDFNIAINPWVGYEANAHVVGYVASSKLGCKVEYKNLSEEIAWQGFGSGEVDVVIENWGHDDLKAKYVEGNKSAQIAGLTGNDGVIGWYVPPWMAEKYPDITDYNNLNKYASMFKTSESGNKGQLLDGDPGFVTNDEALVKNLKLDYKVVYAGSEAALIQAFRAGEKDKKPVIGYFYDPQWFMSEVALVKIDLPPYKDGCDADPAKVACDYPLYKLDKIVATKFAESDSPAYNLVKKFEWTNDDQNLVAKYIAEDKMDAEDAAKKWVDDNPDKVDAWLG
jgi:glycine betaine/proline transport system substrate-binding protein